MTSGHDNNTVTPAFSLGPYGPASEQVRTQYMWGVRDHKERMVNSLVLEPQKLCPSSLTSKKTRLPLVLTMAFSSVTPLE